jgi:hypothetical protein
MPGDHGRRKSAVEAEVVEFLSAYAQYLLAAGIANTRLASLARLAYFKAASARARFGNERLNQSAVAAMTGLTRVQVRQFAKQSLPAPPRTRDRLDSLVEGWRTDLAFLTPHHEPRRLSVKSGPRSFDRLVRLYGGDIPARSVLRELERHGIATVKGGFVSLNYIARQTPEESRLSRVSRILSSLLNSPESLPTSLSLPRSINVEVTYPAVSEVGRRMVQRRFAESLQTFMAGLKEIGLAASSDFPASRKKKRGVTRAKLVLVAEDFFDQR